MIWRVWWQRKCLRLVRVLAPAFPRGVSWWHPCGSNDCDLEASSPPLSLSSTLSKSYVKIIKNNNMKIIRQNVPLSTSSNVRQWVSEDAEALALHTHLGISTPDVVYLQDDSPNVPFVRLWRMCRSLWGRYHGVRSSLQLLFSHSAVSDSLWLHRLQHTRLPCPSPSPGVCSNSCLWGWW